MRIKQKKKAFSLLELVIAMTLFAVVFLSIFSLVGQMQLTQKKLDIAHNFYDESRLLMDRMVEFGRYYVLDYDRYFCEEDNVAEDCDSRYEDVFYDDIGGRLRNLGGMDREFEQSDVETNAFDVSQQDVLFLRHPERNVRIALRVESEQVQVQSQVGVDTNDDGRLDVWSAEPLVLPNKQCRIEGIEFSEDLCREAYDWKTISPSHVRVLSSVFELYPQKDPYLAFADDAVQLQPVIRMAFKFQFDEENTGYGFSQQEVPEIHLQTAVVSRIHGNTR